jgi:phosphoglucomutase
MYSLQSYKFIEQYTTAYTDQNPGTSGLRKKVTHFQQLNYFENFIQSTFNAHNPNDYIGKTLIVGGDGRFYNDKAANKISKLQLLMELVVLFLLRMELCQLPMSVY